MILDWSTVKVFVKPSPTDIPKQINGLSIIITEDLEMDPFGGNLFLFCNKLRRILKIIYWDRNVFCMWLLCEASHNNHFHIVYFHYCSPPSVQMFWNFLYGYILWGQFQYGRS
jgi:transposase